jgi:hypothetical protein
MSARPVKQKRRRLLFTGFDQLYTEIDSLQAGGYTMLGKWNLTQICDHLQLFLHMSMHGFQGLKVPFPIRIFGKIALYNVLGTNSMPAGFKAPKLFTPTEVPVDDPATIEKFRQTIAAYENFTGTLYPSPLFGKIRRDQWNRLHLIHAAHHLGFLLPKSDIST